MTSNTAKDPEVRSLANYAWRVLAPREFVINVLVNAPIAWFVYRKAEGVPLVGWLSLLVICGPMSFILPTLTTYFGTMNGVVARVRRRAGLPWPSGARWQARACVAGLRTAAVVGPVNLVAILMLDRVFPGLTFAKWTAILLVACYGGLLGFWLHARAAIRAGSMYDEGLVVDR